MGVSQDSTECFYYGNFWSSHSATALMILKEFGMFCFTVLMIQHIIQICVKVNCNFDTNMVSVLKYFCSQHLLPCVTALGVKLYRGLLFKAISVGLFGTKYFLFSMISHTYKQFQAQCLYPFLFLKSMVLMLWNISKQLTIKQLIVLL